MVHTVRCFGRTRRSSPLPVSRLFSCNSGLRPLQGSTPLGPRSQQFEDRLRTKGRLLTVPEAQGAIPADHSGPEWRAGMHEGADWTCTTRKGRAIPAPADRPELGAIRAWIFGLLTVEFLSPGTVNRSEPTNNEWVKAATSSNHRESLGVALYILPGPSHGTTSRGGSNLLDVLRGRR